MQTSVTAYYFELFDLSVLFILFSHPFFSSPQNFFQIFHKEESFFYIIFYHTHKREKMSAEDVVAYSDESDTETDEEGEDISNLEEPAPRPTMNTGRRGTVVAAPLQVEEGWQPPVYEKTVEQTQKLRSDLEENVLFKR